MGHVSPAMMKTYSHIRRRALDAAADALEPAFKLRFPKHNGQRSRKVDRERQARQVMSQSTSQSADRPTSVRRFPKKIGSSGWTRTSNPPVNSRMLCH